MTRQYIMGELSARLGQLEAATAGRGADEVARLRHEMEAGPVTALASAAVRAIALADSLCWQSLARGDITAFGRQAEVSAELRRFGVAARLLAEG